jgi:hypothetical protein
MTQALYAHMNNKKKKKKMVMVKLAIQKKQPNQKHNKKYQVQEQQKVQLFSKHFGVIP